MSCRVVALWKRGTEWLANFVVRPAGSTFGASDSASRSKWEKMMCDLVTQSMAGDAGLPKSDIFLFMLGDHVPHRPDPPFLDGLLDSARSHVLGSFVHIVTHTGISPSLLTHDESIYRRWLRWLDVALKGRTASLLQVPYNRIWPNTITDLFEIGTNTQYKEYKMGMLLKDALQRSQDRIHFLRTFAPGGKWGSFMGRANRPDLVELLNGKRPEAEDVDRWRNLLVVVSSSKAGAQRAQVEEALDDFPQRRFLVATLEAVDPSDELKHFCRQHSLLEKPLAFSGIFELWYFFRCLQMPAQVWPPQPLRYTRVELAPEPVFSIKEPTPSPTLLITTAWDAKATDSLRQVAYDLGAMRVGMPLTLPPHVDCAVTPQSLACWLDRPRYSLIWVHAGPGDGSGSLLDAHGTRVPLEDWLSLFQRRGLYLPLVLFLGSHSEKIARSFAEAGARIAVGFADAELTMGSRRLAIDIVQTAVCHSGRRKAILAALHTGPLDSAEEGHRSQPKVFVSDQ